MGERKAFARATRASRSTSRLKPRSTSAGPRIIRTVCASGGVSAPKTGRVAARARARTGRLELGSVSERVSCWPRSSSAARSSAAPDERASGAKPSREPRGRSSPLRDAASLRESARPASSRTLVGAGRRRRLEMTLETVLRLVARRLTQLAKFLVDFPRKYRSRKPRSSSTTWAHQMYAWLLCLPTQGGKLRSTLHYCEPNKYRRTGPPHFQGCVSGVQEAPGPPVCLSQFPESQYTISGQRAFSLIQRLFPA